MSGETDLDTLLSSMSAKLHDDVFVFCTFRNPADAAKFDPIMTFREAEGLTAILPRRVADADGLAYAFPSRMITLEVHSSLDAVGFLAKITTALAQEGFGVNPVSGFYHDHLFVPETKAATAMTVLAQLARMAQDQV